MAQACQYCCDEGPALFKQKNIKFCIPKCGRVLTCKKVCGLNKPEPEDTHDTKCTLCGGEPVKKQEKKQVESIRSSFKDEQITPAPGTQVITQEPEIHETLCSKCGGELEKMLKITPKGKKKKDLSIVELTTCQLCTGDSEKRKKKRKARESHDYDDVREEQSELIDDAKFSADCSEFYDIEFYRRYFQKKRQMADEQMVHRKVWKKQQVKLRIHVEKMISQNTGPDWFQDLSNLQMKLIDSIPETIEEDHQKSSVRGTQVLLYEFGIYPQLCSKLLKQCMLESEADPIKFLFLVHREVVTLETEDYEREYFQAKQFGKKISPFSLNERLLLSGVFHVHFDTFLKKLDDILPPGYKAPKILLGKKPAKPKKKLPSCPYLQPQPINEKSWLEERAEVDLEKKILRDMKFREEITRREKFKKEMDMKERERKFQEETDELIQRAHSAEMKGMLNPQPPSKDSLVTKGKPMREQKNIIVQRMYPNEELAEEEDEVEYSTGIPRLDRLLKYQEISPKLSARFENQKRVYREKLNDFKAKYEDIEILAAEAVSVRSETSSDSDDDSLSDDEDDDSDDDGDGDGEVNPSVDSSGEETNEEDEFPDDNVEAIGQSLEELTQKPQSLLDESEVFRKIGKVREEASKESISEMETEEQSSEDADDTEWSTVLSYKTSMEKFTDDLRADEVSVKSVVFSESDSVSDEKPKKPGIQFEEEQIGEEELEEEEIEEEEDESSEESDHINIDVLSDIRFSDIWGVDEDLSEEECVEEDVSDSEGSDEEDGGGGGDDASDAEDHKKTRAPKRGAKGEKSEMDDLKKTESAASKVDSELEEIKEESFEEELLDEEEASSATPSTVEEETVVEEEVVMEKELENVVVAMAEEPGEQKETAAEQETEAEAESEEESEELESELTEMMEEETLTEITEEISQESDEKREKSYEYVMMEGAYRLNWLDKQNIVQIISGKVIEIDTSPQLLPVKAFPDVPDCELFFELEDGVANDYECGFKKSRASQTDPTEVLCDLKEIIRPFKKRRTILHIDYVDQHIDLQAIMEEQEHLEKEKEELMEATKIPEVELDQQVSPKHMTSGYDDMELQLDPETGEVIRDLEEEEKKRIEAENELEKEIQSRVIDLLSEEVVSVPSEIFQAGKGVIEIDRARIKGALPPPHESPSTTEQEDEAEDRKKQKELDEAAEKECVFSHKPLNVECIERECALIDESELPMNEYTLARRMLVALPEEERLKAAIKYLADKGDPLAILPEIHRVPWLTRWYEKRRGIKLKLTPKENQNLMNQSNVQWLAQYDTVDKVPLKTIEKSDLTWKNIEWVRKRSAQIMDKYQYALKSVLVTNARNYFPTMYCEYYNNPYMKRFRDIFFTYLPGRPNDAYTYRPWTKAIKSPDA